MRRGILPTQIAMLLGSRERVGAEIQQVTLVLPSHVSPERVREGFEVACRRHATLRTTFALDGDTFSSSVQELTSIPWIEHGSRSSLREALTEVRARDRAIPVDVSLTPVFRLTVVRAVDGNAVLWTFHHAHLDGRSIERVLDDVVSTVLGQPSSGASPDPSLHIETVLGEELVRAGRAVFADTLSELREPTAMPVGPSRGVPGPREVHARIRREALLPLATLGERFQFTWATVMHAGWALTLAQLANRSDVVFGSTRACRNVTPASRDVVGCLINTVPFFVVLEPRERGVELLARLREQSLALRSAETVGLEEAASVSAVRRAGDLVRTILVCEGHTLEERMRAAHSELRDWSFTLHGQSSAALTVAVYRTADGGADVVFEVEPTQVDVSEVARLATHFVGWIEELARQPFARIVELQAPGRVVELQGGRQIEAETIPQLLSSSRALHADRDAVSNAANGERLTYRQLWERAERLAAVLASEGARPGDAVAVCARRDVDTVVSFLATQLGGLVYVPVDPRHPEERKQFVLRDCGARFWISRDRSDAPSAIRSIDSRASMSDAFEPPVLEPAQISYLLYTSGSTGLPKGVEVSQRALAAHARAAIETYEMSERDRVLQFASPSFDVYLEEMVPTLASGGTVVVREEAAADSFDVLLSTLARERITILQAPTALFNELATDLSHRGISLPPDVRLVVIGGERANASACRRFRSVEPEVRLVNAYGPTEVTITSVVYDVPQSVPDPVPIGRPWGSCEAFVLDWRGRPATLGVRGELILGGPQVARGYHARNDATTERFVMDPRGNAATASKVYRTGDVVYVDSERRLVFEGRKDEQIKLRGFRIELGEVEHALQRDSAVAEAVAKLVRPRDSAELLAAFVVLSDPTCTVEDLKRRLRTELPSAAVPSRIVIVRSLPRSVGGKVDRAVLDDWLGDQEEVDLTSASPAEQRVASVFAEVLGTPVGLDDDFFDLGGSSLRALRVVSQLTRPERSPTVATLVAHPTARALAEWLVAGGVEEAREEELVRLNEVPDGPTPLFGVVGLHLYSSIARALSRPVFGVYLAEEVAFPDRSLRVPALAHRYLEAIEQSTGAPPKLLAGFSFGSLVVFEMAQQLDARGQRPDLVVLLDPRLPSMLERRRIDPLLDVVALARRDGKEAAAHVLDLVGRKLRRIRDRVVDRVDGDRPELSDERRARERNRAYAEALESYEPIIRPYSGRALIYLARDENPGRLSEVEARWRRLVAPGSYVEIVPGTHGVLLKEPFVQGIHRHLSALLRTRPSVAFEPVTDDES